MGGNEGTSGRGREEEGEGGWRGEEGRLGGGPTVCWALCQPDALSTSSSCGRSPERV